MRIRIGTAITLVVGLATGLGAAEVYTTNLSEVSVPTTYKSVDPGSYANGAVTVGGGGVDWIGNCWQPAETGAYAIDLNQGLGEAGWVQFHLGQTLTAGHQYELTFWMAANPDVFQYRTAFRGVPSELSMGVAVGTNPSASGIYSFDLMNANGEGLRGTADQMGWISYTLSFTADGTEDFLRFSSLTGDYVTMWGPVLGGYIRLNDLTHAPEPSTLMLIGAGLFGVAALKRRVAR